MLLRRRGTEVASLVAEQDVILDRRNADDLYLSTRARHEADAQVLAVVVGALVALARTRSDLAGDVLTETLPWMVWLPVADRAACVGELLEDLRAGTATGHWRRFHTDLAAWRSTAITWSDPDVVAELQLDHDGDGMSEAESAVVVSAQTLYEANPEARETIARGGEGAATVRPRPRRS